MLNIQCAYSIILGSQQLKIFKYEIHLVKHAWNMKTHKHINGKVNEPFSPFESQIQLQLFQPETLNLLDEHSKHCNTEEGLRNT